MIRSACRLYQSLKVSRPLKVYRPWSQSVLLMLAVSAGAAGLPHAQAQSSSSAELQQNLLSYRTQSGGGYGDSGYHQYPRYGDNSFFHHLAVVVGGGFDAPLGNTARTQNYGYNARAGAGYNFNRHIGLLAEYEFHGANLPNTLLAAQQAPQGTVHVWGFSLDPVLYYKNSGGWGGYITGGGGFYRKLTTFSQPVFAGYFCDFYGYCYPQFSNVTLSHFSSNQGGVNLGTGITHSLGQGNAKFFAEARYVWVDSAKATATQIGTGTESLIPVTFGIRF
jgi:hypothetical protein